MERVPCRAEPRSGRKNNAMRAERLLKVTQWGGVIKFRNIIKMEHYQEMLCIFSPQYFNFYKFLFKVCETRGTQLLFPSIPTTDRKAQGNATVLYPSR